MFFYTTSFSDGSLDYSEAKVPQEKWALPFTFAKGWEINLKSIKAEVSVGINFHLAEFTNSPGIPQFLAMHKERKAAALILAHKAIEQGPRYIDPAIWTVQRHFQHYPV